MEQEVFHPGSRVGVWWQAASERSCRPARGRGGRRALREAEGGLGAGPQAGHRSLLGLRVRVCEMATPGGPL